MSTSIIKRHGTHRPSSGLKEACRVTTTANLTLSGLQTIDTVTVVEGDRVLANDQTNGAENGPWVASASAWKRPRDWNADNDVVNGLGFFVYEGSLSGLYQVSFTLSEGETFTLGTTAVTFGTLSPASDYYKKSETDTLLGAKAATADVYTQTQADTLLGAKAPISNPTFTDSFTSPGIDDNATSTAVTIDSNGNLLVGATSNGPLVSNHFLQGASSTGGMGAVGVYNSTGTSGSPALNVLNRDTCTDSTNRFVQFYADVTSSGGTPMGGIVGNGSGSVAFATISDERDKENITPVSSVSDRLKQLDVVEFDFIKAGDHVNYGFIAQNVESHFPEFVIQNIANAGEEPRKGITGGMQSGYIAVLTKALQEALTKIDDMGVRYSEFVGATDTINSVTAKLEAIFTERVGRPFSSYETSEPGALILRGGEFSRTTYAALWAKCGPSGTNVLGPGNGSTTFNVPDYRGRAPRGTDAGAGRDPDAASRSSMFPGTASGDLAGSVQGDIYKKHNHPMDVVKGDGGHGWPHFQTTDRCHARHAHAGGYSGGNETRMKNVGENFFIYY